MISNQQMKQQVQKLIAEMTLEEKAAQVGSYWVYDLQTNNELDPHKMDARLGLGIGQISRNAGASTQRPLEAAKSANKIQKYLKEKTRLGIPAIIHEECCSGLMSAGSTIFPQVIGLASTFQPEFAGVMTAMIRRQTRAIGSHQGLAPVLDVGRDPRWGRIEETFGEDPLLVSRFGVEYIRGLQSDDLSAGVMATAKHFVGHSFSQGGLNCGPVHMGKQEMWDIFLAPFQAAIEDAGLASVMNAYPELDGEVVAASRRILTDLLRDTLGFDGLVVSDYEAIDMIHNYHHMAASKREAAIRAITAGIDVEMPAVSCYGEPLIQAVKDGELSLETLELSVSRHLQKKFELGLFENPFVDEGSVLSVYETPENRKLAYDLACESMVLLKNDGCLPISKSIKNLAVIGPNADTIRCMAGDYSYTATAGLLAFLKQPGTVFETMTPEVADDPTVRVVSVLEGIREMASAGTSVKYAAGCSILGDDESGMDEAVKLTSAADKVVLVVGGQSGLTPKCSTGEFRDATDLGLPGVQAKLVEKILATGKPVVIVLIHGRPVAAPKLFEKAGAVLEAWVPGEEGGRAVAAALFGDVNPGGKLPVSIPRSAGQVQVYYNHKPSGMRSNIYGDYYNEPVRPLFPFGHGLSYTSFEYTDLAVSAAEVKAGGQVTIACTVKNTGAVTGTEVVQLYCRDEYASVPRPVKELKGFARIKLQAGESRRVEFHLPVDIMAFYNLDLKLSLEPGDVEVMLGSSSDDIRLTGSFKIAGEKPVELKKRVYLCPVEIK